MRMCWLLALASLGCQPGVLTELPYTHENVVIYDNDEVIDCYTDDYLMALASAGRIVLRGKITSSSVAPFNKHVSSADYEKMVADRAEGVALARRSGLRNIPDPVRGTKGHLERPPSGQIEDTQPIGSPGSWLIVNEARQATSGKPVVVVMGGPLTVVADAYLLDNSIAERVVVAWMESHTDDMGGYNGWVDPWAAYIAIQKLRLVQFGEGRGEPSVPKARLWELPDTPLRKWMIEKYHPNGLPGERDVDALPAISVMQRDYPRQTRRVSFAQWKVRDGREIVAFKDDPEGRMLVVNRASSDVATEEWWRALTNPKAWGDT